MICSVEHDYCSWSAFFKCLLFRNTMMLREKINCWTLHTCLKQCWSGRLGFFLFCMGCSWGFFWIGYSYNFFPRNREINPLIFALKKKKKSFPLACFWSKMSRCLWIGWPLDSDWLVVQWRYSISSSRNYFLTVK